MLKKITNHSSSRHFTRKNVLIASVVSVLLIGTGVFAYYRMQPKPTAPPITASVPKATPKPPAPTYAPLTGIAVSDTALAKRPLTAIMIENSPDARPQSGLKEAGVVYEAIAEGGITRFLALYQEAQPTLIGPVRSVRPYYVEWATPYSPSIAHIGGSAKALSMVRNGSYRDIDEFFNSSTYWRANDRYAPHNVYTSFEKLDAINAKKGYTLQDFTAFPRQDGKPVATPTATAIDIPFSGPSYNTSYMYDAKTNTYARSVGGAVHNDREKGAITPSVVVAIKVNMAQVFEDGYRESIETTGSGEAYIFQNGQVTQGTWSKKSTEAQLLFTGSDGQPIAFNRGQTWIAAIPNTQTPTWK